MAMFPEHVLTKTRVLDATTVTDVGQNTSLVECLGAKQVIFVVRAAAAEDTDTLIPPSLIGKVASDSDTIAAVALSQTASNGLGVLAGTIPAATVVGSQGYVVTLFPEGAGDVAGYPAARIGAHSVGLFIDVSAGLTLTDVVVDAIVVWN